MFKIIHIPTLWEVLSSTGDDFYCECKRFYSEGTALAYIAEFKNSFLKCAEENTIACFEDFYLEDDIRLDIAELMVVEDV